MTRSTNLPVRALSVIVVLLLGGVGAIDEKRSTGPDELWEQKRSVVRMLRDIETRAVGLETEFKFHIAQTDNHGNPVFFAETIGTWRIDKGRFFGFEDRSNDPDSRDRQRWWDGEEVILGPPPHPMTGQESRNVNWYYSGLPSFVGMFNQCAGYQHQAVLGIPYEIWQATELEIQQVDAKTQKIVFTSRPTKQLALTIVTDPMPHLTAWTYDKLMSDGESWHRYADYQSSDWQRHGDIMLPGRAVCRFQVIGTDGTIGIADHVYERTAVRFEDNRAVVERWFAPELETGMHVTNAITNIQWDVGDTRVFIDLFGYDVAEPLTTDPSPRLSEICDQALSWNRDNEADK